MVDWNIILNYAYYSLGVIFMVLLFIAIRIYGGLAFITLPHLVKYKYHEWKKKKQEENERLLREL